MDQSKKDFWENLHSQPFENRRCVECRYWEEVSTNELTHCFKCIKLVENLDIGCSKNPDSFWKPIL